MAITKQYEFLGVTIEIVNETILWILAKLNIIAASFDNTMALFVIVFATDLMIAGFLAARVLRRVNADGTPLRVE